MNYWSWLLYNVILSLQASVEPPQTNHILQLWLTVDEAWNVSHLSSFDEVYLLPASQAS